MRPTLTLVPTVVLPAPREEDEGLPVTVPIERAGRTPWRTEGETTWVPAALLLASAGRCSCDDCCADYARSRAKKQLARV